MRQDGSLPLGRDMATLGLHPRLSHMVLRGRDLGHARLACEMAAILSERDPLRAPPGFRDPDLSRRVDVLRGRPPPPGMDVDSGAVRRIERVVQQVERQLGRLQRAQVHACAPSRPEPGRSGCCSRSHTRTGSGGRAAAGDGRYVLSGGRGAIFAEAAALGRSEFIVVAALDAGEREARIQLASDLDPALLEAHFASAIEVKESVTWDAREELVAARRVRRLGALVLADEPLRRVDPGASLAAMLQGVRSLGTRMPAVDEEPHAVAGARGTGPRARPARP